MGLAPPPKVRKLQEALHAKAKGSPSYRFPTGEGDGWTNWRYRAIDAHATKRLRRWLCGKHKKSGRGAACYPDEHLHETLGLLRLPRVTRDFPWAKA